jgi:phosphomannomutase
MDEGSQKPEPLNAQAVEWHLERLNPSSSGKSLVVAVDAVNGAGSHIVPELLSRMGCEIIPLAINPELPFPHTPEPLPKNLVWTQDQLQGKTYDLCVVVDPDADRLVIIDENGRLIAEEATIPLVAKELFLKGKRGPIVINMSTSRMAEDVAAEYGCKTVRSKVGEINVVIAMQEEEAVFGGEGGGGIIDPEVHYGRDAMVGIAHIVSLMQRTGKTISQLVDELPHYFMAKEKVKRGGLDVDTVYDSLIAKYPEASVDRRDGLRLDFPDKWLHVRPSNTEPIFRIIAEAGSQKELEELIAIQL